MRPLSYNRLLLTGVAVIFIAAAFLLAASVHGDAAVQDTTLDLAGKTQPGLCTPCHADLGAYSRPGLMFSHGNHLLVRCEACHSRMPHRGGVTEYVPMDACFACHGVQHGRQGELASGKCQDCHTKQFALRPADHVKAWADKPHAEAVGRLGVNRCMMCHEAAKDCDGCHDQKQLDVGKMPETYHNVQVDRPRGPSVVIRPEDGTSMSQCAFCHPDLDAIKNPGLIFKHGAHLARNYRCEACHPQFAHRNATIDRPSMQSCYRCHGGTHSKQGLIAKGTDCLLCHPKTFKLMPNNHDTTFIRRGHGKKASKDPAYCSMCHQQKFCVACHTGKGTSPNASKKPVIPSSHRKSSWKKKHGPLFMDGKGGCAACHDGPSCQRCHKTVLPHPPGWAEHHKPTGGITVQDCYICHTDRTTCQNCHHQNVKETELVAKNCVRCHAEMKKQPPTKIANKAFAEHAVHFNVAKKKGKPYRCYECHIDFGTSAAAQKAEEQQGHDLRLCYGCHGQLDPFNRLIAPYRGAELCLKCHDNLGL